jgi:type IV pilus assembly protein PilQ
VRGTVLWGFGLLLFLLAQGPGGGPALAQDRGPLVTVKGTNMDIRELLTRLGEAHGLSMVMDEGLEGRVTVDVHDVPLWDLLGALLSARHYTYRLSKGGSLLLIEPMGKLQGEEQETEVREFHLRYVTLTEDVVASVRGLLSRRGSVSAVRANNCLLVKDIPLATARVAEYLESLDRRPEQVVIEAKIVEIESSRSRDLGIEWNGTVSEESGDVFGSLGSVEGSAAVNLPPGTEEGLTLGFGLLIDTVSVNLTLAALQEEGSARILSSPRVMVLNNREARITTGTELLIPTLETQTLIQTGQAPPKSRAETFAANLELSVTPRLVGGDVVALTIEAKREEFDFSREVEGFPPKLSRTVRTELLVDEGTTVVIGGIKVQNTSQRESRVPFLSRIPLLGWLFKRQSRDEEARELLVFITPSVLAPEDSAKAP